MRRLKVLAIASVFPLAAAAAEPTPRLDLANLPDPPALAALLWDRSPALQPARLKLSSARADLERAHLLPNPGFDFSWNTIPVGETNPPGLARPLANVPNYAFQLNALVELGKRGPRQRAAADTLGSAFEDARATLFDAFFDLQGHLATIAAAEVRSASLEELAADARSLTELQRTRAQKGDAAQLDVDRSAIEEEKLWSSLADERARLAAALRECGALAGVPCERFGSREASQAFLGRPLPAAAPLDERPDLRSLELQESAAGQALELAKARAIPDPTVRLGYVHDRFLVSGNQQNSLFVGVSVPLPVFDHGQADARLARDTAAAASRTRALLLDQAQTQLERLGEERAALELRRGRLKDRTLPLARSVVTSLQEAVHRGGAPLQDLLLARRTLGELVMDAADLDLSLRQLANSAARVRGGGPEAPAELRSKP
ncbi:MAG TPA: TolC family protein [Myxococcales bacterium]|jgi:cobalt-zinc-cadmium efflux system outer membrane protein